MIFVRLPSETERWHLKQRARREVGRVSERVRMILLSSRGDPIPPIAAILACDEAMVRSWIERFEVYGVEGLRDRPRAGRPPKADAVTREGIRQAVEHGPDGQA